MSNTSKSYSGSNKRDLIEKPNDGEEQKKDKEGNLDLSLNQGEADVFSECTDSPRCVSIIHDYLKNLLWQIHLISNKTIDARINDT